MKRRNFRWFLVILTETLRPHCSHVMWLADSSTLKPSLDCWVIEGSATWSNGYKVPQKGVVRVSLIHKLHYDEGNWGTRNEVSCRGKQIRCSLVFTSWYEYGHTFDCMGIFFQQLYVFNINDVHEANWTCKILLIKINAYKSFRHHKPIHHDEKEANC